MTEELEQQPSEKPDLQQYWTLARRRCWYFFIPLFLGWLGFFIASWVVPAVYRSSTLILIEQPTVPEQYVVPNVSGDLQNRLDSITQQILSRTRLMHIIEKLNLYPNLRSRLGSDDLVDRMRKDIDIELVRSPQKEQLTAFNVYFSAPKPQVAQQVTNELTNLFISENLEVRQQQSESTTQFLESQLGEAGRALAEQEKRLREFKDQHLGELPGQLQSNLEILAGFQARLQAEQDALGHANQQNAYLESLLAQYRTVTGSLKPGENAPMGLPALDQELERLRNQLTDLSSHYTDRHPDLRKVKEQIAKTEKMKQQIAAELKAKAANPQDQKLEGNTNFYADEKQSTALMEVQSQLKANQIEIVNRQEAIEELKSRIGEYQARLNQTPVREQQLADLSRDYDQSKANYESLLGKRNQSELATSLEKRQQGEHFRILDPPSLPKKPYFPNRLKLSLLGLLVGVLLGVGSVFGAEFVDDRLYSEKEFKELFPAALLAEIPSLSTLEEERKQQQRVWRDLLGVCVVVLCIAVGTVITYIPR